MVIATTRDATERNQGRRAIKAQRIAVRVTEELQERVNDAAELTGRTVSEFVTEAIQEKADAVILEQRRLESTERDMDALLAALDAPAAPVPGLLKARERWHALIDHGD